MASFKFLQLAKGNSIFFPQLEYTRKNIPQKKRSFESYIQGIEKIHKHGKIRGFLPTLKNVQIIVQRRKFYKKNMKKKFRLLSFLKKKLLFINY